LLYSGTGQLAIVAKALWPI